MVRSERLAALANFEHEADQIVEAYHRRLRLKNQTCPYDGPIGTFKRDAYKLLRKTISSEGRHNVIKSIVMRFNVEPARLHYIDNRFHFGLLAIDPNKEVIDQKKLSLWSRQLAYADLHGVEAHFLLGFLWQSGSSDTISKKLREGHREPWFLR